MSEHNNIENNKRIAKNTILLYFRMIFLMLISLYTSRVVLNTLGVEDYGIYNVVGGVVTIFAFLNAAMNASTQRYMTFYLGKGDIKNLQKIFSNCMFIHMILAAIVVFLAETIGLWFLYNKMIIPDARVDAAFWVFQCSIVATVIMILSAPYNADIIAHERMSAFAYISIAEAILKLLIVFLLSISSIDKLILYAILLLIVQIMIRCVYGRYCNKHFIESHLIYDIDKQQFKEMSSFIGWNVFGGLSAVMYTQGLNMLLNVFFGPVVNAARGIAVQVQNVVLQFSQNFQTAINPQITKSYATGDLSQMHNLIYKSSKYTFFLLLLISLPVFLEAKPLLTLWLKIVPDWTVTFLRIMLCITLVDSVANPLMVSSAATGKVKLYQSVIGGTMLSIVPIAYFCLKFGCNPSSVFVVHLSLCLITFIMRLFIIKPMIKLSIRAYLKNVIVICFIVGFFSIILPLSMYILLDDTIKNEIIIMLFACICCLTSVFFIGLTSNERKFVIEKFRKN